MNPVLLKPNTDIGAQVIIQGCAIGTMYADAYHDYKCVAREAVLASYRHLCSQYSPAVYLPWEQRRRAVGERPDPRHLPAWIIRIHRGLQPTVALGGPR
jgi:hypothetical protein